MKRRSLPLFFCLTLYLLLSVFPAHGLAADANLCRQVRQASGLPVTEAKGFCQISLNRNELAVRQAGTKLPGEMLGLALSADIAVVNGQGHLTAEFALLEKEINPVISRVRQAGFTVSALHNHWLYERPRILYLHFQATGDPATLAAGLRRAIDATSHPIRSTGGNQKT